MTESPGTSANYLLRDHTYKEDNSVWKEKTCCIAANSSKTHRGKKMRMIEKEAICLSIDTIKR